MMRSRIAATTLCVALVGCHHKRPPAAVIPPPAPVAVAGVAVPKTPPQLPTETPPKAPMPTVAAVPGAPAKKAKKKAAAPAPAPTEVASAAPPPPPVAIGSLSAETDLTAQNRKNAADLIVANEKRLAELPSDVKHKEKGQIVRVRNFQVDAQKALNGGDAEGALTLATKAKVLLDELTK